MLFGSLLLFSSPPEISDFRDCFLKDGCTAETKQDIFYSFCILFAAAIYGFLIRIFICVKKYRDLTEKIGLELSATSACIKQSISVIHKDQFEKFYEAALEKIKKMESIDGNNHLIIRATSSFTPPDHKMRDRYFKELAKIITKRQSPSYRVILAKGNNKEWDIKCREELKIRKSYLDNAARENGRDWEYNVDFSAKRSRYHSRIDFLIIDEYVFLNVGTSSKNDERGYIYVQDKNVASIFNRWFDLIWEVHSKPVLMQENGDFEFS